MPKTDDSSVVQDAINKVRPLNATQAKALRTLVEQDFDVVGREMYAMVVAEKQAAKERVEAEFRDKGADAGAFEQNALDLINSFENELRSLIRQAEDKGVALYTHINRDRYSNVDIRQHVRVETKGKDEALSKAYAEIDRNYQQAANELRRQQNGVERRILVAQVTGDAEDLLNSLPSAQSLMVEAAKQKAAQQIKP